MRAVVVTASGGPEVLEVRDVPAPEPAPGHLLVDVDFAGINYRDVYEREGTYGAAELPFVAGHEAAGRVRSLGDGVTGVAPGDRVVWWEVPRSYAEQASIPAQDAVPIPDGIDTETACAVLLQGLTAHALATTTYAIQAGDWVLVHSAAGGVGMLLTQIAKLRGGRVIGTTSSEAKADFARAAGADVVLRYEDVPDRVREVSGGGVAAAYDAVGGESFAASLRALRNRGVLVGYGMSNGQVPAPVEPGRLGRKSLYLTWMLLPPCVETREELLRRSADLFGWIADGRLKVKIGGCYPLDQVRQAQAALSSRSSIGKLLLRVS